MEQNVITSVLLPVALGVIMLGLGLSLTLADFKRVIVYPKAVAIGLACQMLILPFACLGIAHAFDLPPALAVGLMLLAASPGGATANLFSHLAKGDVALNITLTSYAGELHFGLIGCRRSVPRLQRLLLHLEASLHELEEAVL